MKRIVWYLKQLLPLTYVSTYGQDGDRWVTVWRQWFGRTYNVRRWRLAE